MSNPFDTTGGFDDIAPPAQQQQGYGYAAQHPGPVSVQHPSAYQQPAPKMSEVGVRRSPPEWVPDVNAAYCMSPACGVQFDTFERRHHCRYCGQIYCEKCSSRSMLMPPSWEGRTNYATRDPQRVCEACAATLERYQTMWSQENANANRENQISLDDYSTRYMNSPLRFTLGGEVRKAAYALRNLTDGVNYWEGDAEYFDRQLAGADGLMFLTVGKIAFIGGVRVGTGLVVARLPDGSWSAPCAVGSFGVTFGAVVGAEVTDFITPLDRPALDEFCDAQTSKVAMGGEASFAFGPLGRTAGGEVLAASDSSAASTTSYAQSRGFYGGVTVDAAYVKVRDDVNLKFYGRPVQAADLLRGLEKQPHAAGPLYEQLHAFYALLDQRSSVAATLTTNQHQAYTTQQQQPAAGSRLPASGQGYSGQYGAPPPPQPQYTDVRPPHQTPPQQQPTGVGDSLWGSKPLNNPFGQAAGAAPGGAPRARPANDVVEV